MPQKKTQENNPSVREFINDVKNEKRRKDSQVILKIMKSISGKSPKMWGTSIIGFGKIYYKYANGKETDICKIGFSPRAQYLTLYLATFKEKAKLLDRLGKHKISAGGCLYINKLEDIDLSILEKIIESAYKN